MYLFFAKDNQTVLLLQLRLNLRAKTGGFQNTHRRHAFTISNSNFSHRRMRQKADRASFRVCTEPHRVRVVRAGDARPRPQHILRARLYLPLRHRLRPLPHTSHAETVCQLVLRKPVVHVDIDVDVEELVQDKRGLASYEQIKAYVLEHSGFKVSHLYIAQVKRKCGIIERENYNKPKSEDARQPQCPPEKEAAIRASLEHFGMV